MDDTKKLSDDIKKLSVYDIIDRLKEIYGGGYKVDNRTIRNDINNLINSGIQIDEYTDSIGKKLYSYVEDFNLYEIRLLLDAVYSSKSITNTERKKLLNKINKLTKKEVYDSKLHVPQLEVSESNSLKYYLDKIHRAIFDSSTLKFQYGNYNTDKKFELHNFGSYYFVEPYNLVWSNDFYYLVAFDKSRNKFINYRVDRMRDVEIQNVKYKIDDEFNINSYLKSCFNMYPGEIKKIKIKFKNKLINAIIDRFGKEVNIVHKNDSFFTIEFEAAVNEGLVRWILNWGADAEVLSPKTLILKLIKEIDSMDDLYKKSKDIYIVATLDDGFAVLHNTKNDKYCFIEVDEGITKDTDWQGKALLLSAVVNRNYDELSTPIPYF